MLLVLHADLHKRKEGNRAKKNDILDKRGPTLYQAQAGGRHKEACEIT